MNAAVKRWVVYGFEHPALATRRLGQHRYRWMALLHVRWFKIFGGALLWSEAWIHEESP